MNISSVFIRRPVMTTLLTLSVLLLGLLAYKRLPVSDLPNVDHPSIQVMTFYSGASSESVVNLVTKPLEQQLNGVQGLEEITSRSMTGFSSVTLRFKLGHEMAKARQDVQRAIDQAEMPADLRDKPRWVEDNPSDSPIMYLVVSSPLLQLADIYEYADRYLAQPLASVPGVAQVQVWGSQRVLNVKLDAEALAAHNVSIQEVQTALQRANPHHPLGVLKSDESTLSLSLAESVSEASQLEQLVIRRSGEQLLLLRDFAEVVESADAKFGDLLYREGEHLLPAAILPVRKQPGANVAATLEAVKGLLAQLERRLPPSMRVSISYDKSVFIDAAVREVQETLVLAVLLVIVIIFVSVGSLKETFIPATAIPLSVLITFLVMQFLGYSVNVLTLLALTLAIGFVVDDAIVVMENILRYKEKGLRPLDAALKGAGQVGFTIVAMTLSLVAVFIPLVFMEGMLGKLFREFSVTLAVAVLASGVVSLTLTPMLCRWMRIEPSEAGGGGLKGFADRLNAGALALYKPLLRLVLRYQKTTLLFGGLSLGLSFYLYQSVPVDFLPTEDTSFVTGWMATDQSSSKKKTVALLKTTTDRLMEHPGVADIIAVAANSNGAFLFIKLAPHEERASITQVIDDLNVSVAGIPGKNLYLRPFPFLDLSVGDEGQGQYQYELRSLKLDALFRGAERLKERMNRSAYFTGVYMGVAKDRPELQVKLRDDLMAKLGISSEDVVQTLHLAYSKVQVGKILSDYSDVPINMELQSQYKRSLASLDQVYLKARDGQMIPVMELVEVEERMVASAIEHTALFPSLLINFNLAEGVSLTEALDELDTLKQESLPEGVSGDLAGAGKVIETYADSMAWLIAAAIVAMYVVLGVLYESFIHPLTILSTLPFAILGALVTLLLFGESLSLYGFIGVILLIGLVKKNGIMIVDYTLDMQRRKGMKAAEAVYQACLLRFRPIMMTTAAAILGALPIAIGHGSATTARATLGLVIIGGLVFSQLLTLLFTPVMYLLFEKLSRSNVEE